MTDFVLREFTCVHCGHKVVVNPKLPPDYEPKCCSRCWDQIVLPKHDKAMYEISLITRKLCEALGTPIAPPLTKAEEDIVARRVAAFEGEQIPSETVEA